jgi:hypothetical protein
MTSFVVPKRLHEPFKIENLITGAIKMTAALRQLWISIDETASDPAATHRIEMNL